MEKIKNLLPIEFYLLLIPSAIIFFVASSYLKNFSVGAFGIEDFLKVSFGISSPLSSLLMVLSLVLFFIVALKSGFAVIRKIKGDQQNKIEWKQALSIVLLILFLSFVTYSLMLFTDFLFKAADPIKTADLGKMFLTWDRAIFRTDPGIWLIHVFGGTAVQGILLWIYNSIFFMFSLVLIFSFFLNKNAFRRMVLSFFICWIISFPIWFSLPTMPPDMMFRLNKLNLADAAEVQAFNNFTPDPQLKWELGALEKIHIVNQNPANRSLPTSTFPSMHAAWGVVIAYAGVVLWPWLGIILIPWAILNGVACVFILEHFSVDIFLGFIIAFIVILITELALRLEKKYFNDKFGLLSGFDYINIKSLARKAKEVWKIII